MKGGAFSDSILETRLRRFLENSPLPQAVAQYVVTNGDRFVARVDFAWPDVKVAVEGVSRKHHEGQWERDVARLNALTTCGWIVIHVTWEDLHVRPHEILLTIAQALGITF
jgi:very-short-patch-repair endonuclease